MNSEIDNNGIKKRNDEVLSTCKVGKFTEVQMECSVDGNRQKTKFK